MTLAVVFGGGGFLGRRLVGRLTAEGMTVHVVVRHPDPARIAQKLLQYIIDQLAAGVFNRPSGTIVISLQTAASGFPRCAGAARVVGRSPAPLARLLAGGCLHDHWAASMMRAVSAASSICGQCPASSA